MFQFNDKFGTLLNVWSDLFGLYVEVKSKTTKAHCLKCKHEIKDARQYHGFWRKDCPSCLRSIYCEGFFMNRKGGYY